MYQIAICDDEPKICSLYRTKVETLLREHGVSANVDIFTNPLEFMETAKKKTYELLLLDIDMPKMNGFQLAEQMETLRGNPLLVFVTNQDALVYQTFWYHPFGFIRKSCLEEELEKVLFAAVEELAGRQRRYTFRHEKETVSVMLSQILYFESDGNYLLVYTKECVYRIRETMVNAQQELAKDFVRIHKGFLVNEEAVYRIGTDEITLIDGTKLPLGRSNREQTRARLMRHLLT